MFFITQPKLFMVDWLVIALVYLTLVCVRALGCICGISLIYSEDACVDNAKISTHYNIRLNCKMSDYCSSQSSSFVRNPMFSGRRKLSKELPTVSYSHDIYITCDTPEDPYFTVCRRFILVFLILLCFVDPFRT